MLSNLVKQLDRQNEAWMWLGIRPPFLVQLSFDIIWVWRVLFPQHRPSTSTLTDTAITVSPAIHPVTLPAKEVVTEQVARDKLLGNPETLAHL